MQRVRTVDFAAFDRAKYTAQYLYQGESCVITGSLVPAGKPAYTHHRHEHCDQLYFVVHGEMHVQLGETEHVAGPNSIVHIPQGLPHHNWNEGDVDEFHLEVLAPAPRAHLPLATPTADADAAGLLASVRVLDESRFVESERFPGFALNQVLQNPSPTAHAAMYVGRVQPGSGGPGTHVHAFDQFYFVLAGELSVEVGLERFTVRPGSLVAIPAGVPHRQWNEGTEVERHIALNTPTPEAGRPLDIGVEFAPNGEVI